MLNVHLLCPALHWTLNLSHMYYMTFLKLNTPTYSIPSLGVILCGMTSLCALTYIVPTFAPNLPMWYFNVANIIWQFDHGAFILNSFLIHASYPGYPINEVFHLVLNKFIHCIS